MGGTAGLGVMRSLKCTSPTTTPMSASDRRRRHLQRQRSQQPQQRWQRQWRQHQQQWLPIWPVPGDTVTLEGGQLVLDTRVGAGACGEIFQVETSCSRPRTTTRKPLPSGLQPPPCVGLRPTGAGWLAHGRLAARLPVLRGDHIADAAHVVRFRLAFPGLAHVHALGGRDVKPKRAQHKGSSG